MGYILGVPILGLLTVLQATIFGQFRLLDGAPDLILLATIGWALTGQRVQAMTFGLIGGLLLDLFSGLPLGASSIALVLAAFLVSLIEGRFWEAHLLMPLAAVLGTSIVFHGINLLVMLLLGRLPVLSYALTQVVLPSVFLNVVLALPVAQIAESLESSLYPPEVGI
ncbi:MAG: rod shape-determining protein MreD [Anaerolineales bacterium]